MADRRMPVAPLVGRAMKFPDPKARSREKPVTFCDAKRLIKLYNQAHTSRAENVSKSVRNWFISQAHQRGWAGVQFLPDGDGLRTAGCLLWIRQERPRRERTDASLVLEGAQPE